MRSHHLKLLSSLALLGPGWVASAQQLADVPTLENFYRKASVSATVIGNYVYIDGGELSQLLNGVSPAKQHFETNRVNSTISIDLSKSWTTSDVVLRTIDRPWGSKANQVIWTDHAAGNFYVWAGTWLRGPRVTENELWKFTPDGSGGGTWALEPPANAQLFDGLHQAEFVAFANSNDTGFAIGGVSSGWTKKSQGPVQAIPGMVAFNMETKIWQNGTTDFSPIQVDTLAAGSAHYIPTFGPNGLIILLGGVAHPVDEPVNWGTARPYDLQNLTFFDPQAKKTYWQVATGTIPPSPRSQFCLAGFQNVDGGYELLLMGGFNHRDLFRYSDAYILSLPGFVWTKAPDSPTGERRRPACVSVGNRQMLMIGGTGNGLWDDKDAAPQGLALFDMTEMKWKDSYDADAAAYERPADIKAWYNNGSFEAVAWSSDQVRQLFVSTNSTDDPQNPGASPSPSADPSASESTPVGAIVGGVVGGVAGIALIAAVAWLLIRRRARRGANLGSVSDGAHGHGVPEAIKTRPTGRASIRTELPSEPEYLELGASVGYTTPEQNHNSPLEMDATPATPLARTRY